jgi:omega-6 fatty acid desaturase (delta-12 desaturase)
MIDAAETANTTARTTPAVAWPDWYPAMLSFRQPRGQAAARQLVSTLLPYCILWYLMILSVERGRPYALTLLLSIPASAFLVRAFILFHDCVHDSFFASKRMNTFLGYLIGVLTFTSFEDWRMSHLRHHATYANLDTRGFGDIWTLTLKEYENLSKRRRLLYRLYRTPLVLVGLGAWFNFLLSNRLPARASRRKERVSVVLTNLLILAVALAVARIIGWRTYLAIQLPVVWLAGAAGIWLFYVQHQFPGGYWARKGDWVPLRAAFEGSSYYRLPALLRWFSADIGLHHVHHLNPRIANYRLQECFDAIPALKAKAPLSIRDSFAGMGLKLWDEERQRLVPFP